MNGPTRWGVVSAGNMAHDFMVSVKEGPPEKHQVVAVAARDADRARARAEEFGVTNHYGSYEELAKDPNIDVVYVAAFDCVHAEVSKMFLRAGKPVVVEVPVTQNERELREVLAVAKENNLFFMKAVWPRFYPAYHRMLKEIQKGTIGEPQLMTFSGGQVFGPDSFILSNSGPGGVFKSYGQFGIIFAQDLFGINDPEEIVTTAVKNPSGKDETSNVVLHYPGKKMVVITTTAVLNITNKMTIYGTKGKLEFPEPYFPTKLTVNDEEITFPCPKPERDLVFGEQGVMGQYMIDHVRDMLHQGRKESPVVSVESTLSIMRVLDKCRAQMGVPYY